MLRINNISLPLAADLSELKNAAAQKLNCSAAALKDFRLSKKSVDARNKRNVHFVYSVDCQVDGNIPSSPDIETLPVEEPLKFKIKDNGIRPLVVGSGPAGMFAGLALAEAGLKPLIIERGADVITRKKIVDTFWKIGKLNPETNVQFGEGGAGTFSDGKLMSGIKKDKFTAKVMRELYLAGAPQEILYLAKPHVGTDNLRIVVQNIRKKIESLGGEYLFNHRLEELIIRDSQLIAAKIQHGEDIIEMPVNRLFLAIGHSARDTFEMLHRSGVHMIQKPFSVGARIEHRQADINRAQYGSAAQSPYLGAADYKLAVHLPNGRAVYTFCMCPGGTVVAAASEPGRVVTNGMSEFARNRDNANSALLVGVDSTDFASPHPLAGMYFQRQLEERAFVLGGKNYAAPAQLVGDFLNFRASTAPRSIQPSYAPFVCWSNFDALFSQEIAAALRTGIIEMAKKLPGFATPDAVLTGVETRSSSPVRIVRDDTMQSNIKGLYPCGEGAGYAGGITSSAADALKVVYSLNEN